MRLYVTKVHGLTCDDNPHCCMSVRGMINKYLNYHAQTLILIKKANFTRNIQSKSCDNYNIVHETQQETFIKRCEEN